MVRTIRPSGKGWELDFVGRDPARQPVASRIMSLNPGAHELELSAQGGSGFLQTDVHCLDREGRRVRLGTLADEGQLAFTVPQSGCPVQVVDLKAGVASCNRLRITID